MSVGGVFHFWTARLKGMELLLGKPEKDKLYAVNVVFFTNIYRASGRLFEIKHVFCTSVLAMTAETS